KPGNVLVGREGVPKLVAFGLPNLLDEEITDKTATMVRILTPHYASPEQVRGEPVTTATDIYSLGAMLYELISGRKAYQFESSSPAEVERVICASDPPPLGGELGNIVRMAMRKEPERRYLTVDQLSEDIRRYLACLPVVAQKDTLRYRARKFVVRHRLGVAASSLAVLALAAATVFATVQARLAQRRFGQLRDLVNSLVLDRDLLMNARSFEAQERLSGKVAEALESLAAESS